ncbi:MAG: DEAD/DEAH box helicase family protein [Streptococcaceae bacterium]|jgi:hypothetical protein|nr:DEAD/DEAH box helicase family protein [Streptococcaceae bacterium]
MKNQQEVYLVNIYPDLFSGEEFVLLKSKDEIFISKLLEFQANLSIDSQHLKRTTTEKLALYRSFFKGRETMIATSFENSSGKRVYYPWCLSRKKGICPKIKKPNFPCTSCHVQKFQTLTNDILTNHLRGVDKQGREVFLGIYPLTENNEVFFLVFDFDKKDWRNSVTALLTAAKFFKLTPLIEISQSGNGCHIWFFFADAIKAKIARNFGKSLLKFAMLNSPELSFDSYDRMFPNQDELTDGGFGNLIALPLQGTKVQKGFSRFVDEQFHLMADVWETLESVKKLSEVYTRKIIEEIGNRLPTKYYKPLSSDLSQTISLFDKNSLGTSTIISEKQLTGTISNHITLSKSELSKEELVQLKFLATFHNKAFYTARRKRLSTKGIPQYISLAELDKSNIYLPRGLEQKIRTLFPQLSLIEKMTTGRPLDIYFKGELLPSQQMALSVLEKNNMGILCAGTGFGKTVIAANLIAIKQVSTLILVHNKNLANQWKASLEQFLEIHSEPMEERTKTGRKRKKSKIGKIYGGTVNRSGLVDIALFQSATKISDLPDILQDYGMVIVDEAHHVAAKTFEDVIKQVSSQFVYGLTATPKREDGLENILYMRLGEICHIAEKEIPKHIVQKLYLRFTTVGEHLSTVGEQTLHENYKLMIDSNDRTEQLLSDILNNLNENRHLIVLTRYIGHLNVLKSALEKRAVNIPIYALNGKMQSKQLKEELHFLKREGKPFVLLTTGSYAGEGFDLPALDTLLLAMPISSKTNLKQYLGRLLRNLEEKEELRVYDYVDYAIPMVYRMYQKRLRTYQSLGYHLQEDEHTELSKSNLFTENYESILLNDLASAKVKVILILPYLDKSTINFLSSITFSKELQQKILFLPSVNTVPANYRLNYQQNIQKLKELNYQIFYKNQVQQKFILLDNRLVWSLPNNSRFEEDIVAFRIYSADMVSRLDSFFNQ